MIFLGQVKDRIAASVAGALWISLAAASAAQSAQPNPWVVVKGEPPALSLEDTSFAGQRAVNTTLVHHNGSRNDWIRSGTLAVVEPNLIILMARLTDPNPVLKTVVEAIEELNDIKSSRHSFRPTYYAMTTRFGELRGIMFDVNADGVRKYCVGFHKPTTDELFVKGYVCSTEPSQVEPSTVSCLIDKVRYVGPSPLSIATPAVQCGATALDPKGATIPNLADRL